MLLPFERNLFNISDFKGSYISTLLNDVFRFENVPGGMVVCVTPGKTGYVLFRNGKILNVCAVMNEPGENHPKHLPFRSFFDIPLLDVYVNAIEDTALIDDLNTLFSMPVMFSAPYVLTDTQKLFKYIKELKLSGTMGFKHGAILNTAFFFDGSFSSFYYYHSGTKSYTGERTQTVFNAYLAANEKLHPYIIFTATGETKGVIDKRESEMFRNDPLLSMFLCYGDIFEALFKFIKEKIDEDRVTEICDVLFKSLRDKYYPLYSTISYSRESGTVNWNSLYDERKYISAEYRFAQFHLYLDELLKLLLKIALSVYGPDEIIKIIVKIRKYFEVIDKNDLNMKEMVYRVDKILEKLK